MMKSRKRCRNSYEPSTAKRNEGKRRQGLGEAIERCPRDARTDFADAGVAMRNPGIDHQRGSALQRKRCLPSSVIGPAFLHALQQLASICLKDVMDCLP